MSKAENWETKIIEAGYRELAKRHHPDHGGKNDDMAALNSAAETLRKFATLPSIATFDYSKVRKQTPAVQVNPAPGVILNIDVAEVLNTFVKIFGAQPVKRRKRP